MTLEKLEEIREKIAAKIHRNPTTDLAQALENGGLATALEILDAAITEEPPEPAELCLPWVGDAERLLESIAYARGILDDNYVKAEVRRIIAKRDGGGE